MKIEQRALDDIADLHSSGSEQSGLLTSEHQSKTTQIAETHTDQSEWNLS